MTLRAVRAAGAASLGGCLVGGCVVAAIAPTARAEPVVTAIAPQAVLPAATARLQFAGKELADGVRVATSPVVGPFRIESVDSGKTSVAAAVDVPADAIGPLGVWPSTAAGPSLPRTLLVDDLPSVAGGRSQATLAAARTVSLPAGIDGTCTAAQSDFYRFHSTAGQRIAVEVVTRQIGSPMDPYVRLLDATGKVLVANDDGPVGSECRFSHVVAAAGDHVIEVRDNAHLGGMRYRLRIGDFPIVSHAMPLAVQRGSTTRVGFGGADAADARPVDVTIEPSFQAGARFVAAKLPGGRSSAWTTLLVHDAPQLVEPSADLPLPVPVGVSGRLSTPGERDAFRVRGRKGETLRVTTRGRSLGCATVPRLRLVDAAGKVVAESAVTKSDEPELAHTFAADGDHRLEVDDLARRGGPDYGYFLAIEPAGAAVSVKADPKGRLAFAIEPGQGCAPIDLAVKRAGHDGAITVALAEPVPGLTILDPVIPEKAVAWRIHLAADESWSPDSLAVVRLVARAGPAKPSPVSTEALRGVLDKVVGFPSPVADGAMLMAGVAAGPKRFELAPASAVQLARTGTSHRIALSVRRLDPALKGPVSIAGGLLPRGFAVTSEMEKDACVLTLTGSASAGSEPASLRLLAVSDVGNRTAVATFELPVTWTGDASMPIPPPASRPVANAPASRPPAFDAGYAKAVESLGPRLAGPLSNSAAPLAVKGGVRFDDTRFATFTGGRLDGGGPALGSSWSVSLWFTNELAVTARPVTAYLFSRGADGDASGGDHLGVGGNYRPEMPGRLFVFNGNARNTVAVGRTPLEPGTWHHVVMIRDGRRTRVHLDGAERPEIDAEVEPTAPGVGGFFFAARNDSFAPLRGGMAHVALFDRPLSVDEVQRLFTSAAATPPPPASKNGDQPQPAAPEPQAPATPPPTSGTPPPAAAPAAAAPEPLGPGLHVHPSPIDLDGGRDRQRIAITTVDAAGFPCDRTREASIRVADPTIAVVRDGTIFPVGDGTTEAVVEADGLQQSIPIAVRNVAVVRPVQFENELMAALSRQTCSSGACHGSPSGKGGFRLSLRASEKPLDELTLIREEFGRRVNPIDPDASLLLRKPLMQVPHGGGRQLAVDDDAHAVIRTWIAEGAKADPPDTPRCVRLEVSPAGRQVQRLGEGDRQIVATAHLADGSRRDVSHLVAYESSAPAIASVDADGWVEPRKRGEAVILVRYLEHIELVPLMFIEQEPGFAWEPPPGHNEIDRLVDEKLRDLQYPPSQPCTDAEFVRRVHLDVIGMLPTVEETTAFLADRDPQKRSRLVDRLLERDEHARFWALKWGDILRMTKKLAGDQGVFKYHRWLEDSFRENKPHDRLARELLLGAGSTFGSPPANFYRTTADMNETVETVSQLFLGVRMQCAKCHNHPFDRWSQDDYHGLGAFFDRVRKRETPIAGEMFVYVASTGETVQPRTGRTVKPWLPGVGDVDVPADADRREAFANWLLAHDNPFFARVEANRIWSQFFARGIVHPVDEFRDSNPPSNAPLLDWLAAEFTGNGFDRKALIRTILRSRTYQASSVATPRNRDDSIYFSHQSPRLLSAEQILDAIDRVTGLEQPFGPLPAGTRATQLPAPDIAKLDFLKMFGQPERGTVCACERADDSSLGMAIELFNGKVINARLADPASRFRKALAAGAPPDEVIRELYVAAVCRQPTDEELSAAIAQCRSAKDVAAGVADVCWALVNSDEFIFQH